MESLNKLSKTGDLCNFRKIFSGQMDYLLQFITFVSNRHFNQVRQLCILTSPQSSQGLTWNLLPLALGIINDKHVVTLKLVNDYSTAGLAYSPNRFRRQGLEQTSYEDQEKTRSQHPGESTKHTDRCHGPGWRGKDR